MKRPEVFLRPRQIRGRRPGGYTLLEMLMATALTLLMMGVVVRVFGQISGSVADSRSTLEMADRLRATAARLQMDLAALTVTMRPPRSPESNEGYFEIIEGPVGPVIPVLTTDPTLAFAVKPDPLDPNGRLADTTVGDVDDVLMFTTHSKGRPFVGRCDPAGGSIESDVAEVAWFIRGRSLFRRVLLVAPGVSGFSTNKFYEDNDISVHYDGSKLIANTLGDLTKRECRFAHQTGSFPFDASGWGQLGLPTLRECSSHSPPAWEAGNTAPVSYTSQSAIDFWNNPHPWPEVDPITGTLNTYLDPHRIAEDVILDNVIGFDVKVWDPGAPVVQIDADPSIVLAPGEVGYPKPEDIGNGFTAVSYGAYVDLGYWPQQNYENTSLYVPLAGAPEPLFHHNGDPRSGLKASKPVGPVVWNSSFSRVYDTWSLHYECDGIDQFGDGNGDLGDNGFDDDVKAYDVDGDGNYDFDQRPNGIVDDPGERETAPPYPAPLRGIRVKIRVFEPDSRQIRELTVVEDFLAK